MKRNASWQISSTRSVFNPVLPSSLSSGVLLSLVIRCSPIFSVLSGPYLQCSILSLPVGERLSVQSSPIRTHPHIRILQLAHPQVYQGIHLSRTENARCEQEGCISTPAQRARVLTARSCHACFERVARLATCAVGWITAWWPPRHGQIRLSHCFATRSPLRF